MTNWIWNVCTLLLLSFQFKKKTKEKGFICCFLNHDIHCPMKNKQPPLFLDLSHDLAWSFFSPPAKLSQHCVVDIFAAVIPQSKHKFSIVHASYCRGLCVWSWIRELLESHTLATVYTTGQQLICVLVFVSPSSCKQSRVPRSSMFQLVRSAKNWSAAQQWNLLQKQLRTQKRQQVNIQHIKTPRYSF